MKQESKQQPQFIELDLDQWRRDVQTFATTTHQALDAIVSQLSNRCSGAAPVTPKRTAANAKTRPSKSADRKQASVRTANTKAHQTPIENSTSDPSTSEGKLASIKERLAQRINQSR